jgi:hypothetical protein
LFPPEVVMRAFGRAFLAGLSLGLSSGIVDRVGVLGMVEGDDLGKNRRDGLRMQKELKSNRLPKFVSGVKELTVSRGRDGGPTWFVFLLAPSVVNGVDQDVLDETYSDAFCSGSNRVKPCARRKPVHRICHEQSYVFMTYTSVLVSSAIHLQHTLCDKTPDGTASYGTTFCRDNLPYDNLPCKHPL